jgi:hypothetical protein
MKDLINFWIPSKGEESIIKTIESIQKQTHSNCKTTIGTDSEEGHESISEILKQIKPKNTIHYKFPEKVTEGRPELLTTSAIYSLNYDYWQPIGCGDWFEKNHAEEIIKTYKQGADWVFTLRQIWDKEGNFICKDIFESIGFYPVWNTPNYYFVDGQSFCIPKGMAYRLGHAFCMSREYNQRTDKFVFDYFAKFYPKFKCTKKYTLNFKLDRGSDQDLDFAKKWYKAGEDHMKKKFPKGDYPWLN